MSPSNTTTRRISASAIALSALLLSSLPLLTGCDGSGTKDQLLLDHSGYNPNSPYRQHHGSR